MTTKNTFDAKKNQIAAVYAWNGGVQPNTDTAFGREWIYKSPAEINTLIRERG